MKATVDALGDVYINIECIIVFDCYNITYQRRLCVARVDSDGQCEGLVVWDE